MRCPQCKTQAADNAAFCPKCDYILDPSLFLEEPPPEESVENTNPGARRDEGASPRAAPSSWAAPSSVPRRKASRGRAASAQKMSAEKTTEKAPVDPTPQPENLEPQWFSDRAEKSDFNEAEMLLSSLKTDFMALPGPDKLMIVGALGMLLSCFFPWQTLERSGDVLGFLSLGALMVPLSIGSFLGMVWRNRTHESLPLLPWLLQGLCGLIAIVSCLVLIKIFWVSTSAAELLGAHAETSSPAIGLFVGLTFAILNLAGTGLGLKQAS